jgi:hypothetical protein
MPMRRFRLLQGLFILACAPLAFANTLPSPVVPGGVTEGNAGTRPLAFGLRWLALPGAPGPYQVLWQTADGAATAGSDYVAAIGTVALSPQQPFVPLQVEVLGDTDIEPGEDIRIEYAVLGTSITGVTRLWINDDDGMAPPPPPPAVNVVHALDAATREPGAGSTAIALSLLRTGPLAGPLEIGYALDAQSTATVGADWLGPTGGVVRFEAGEAVRRIELSVLADSVVEPTETVRFRLEPGVGALLPKPWVAATLLDSNGSPVTPAVGVIACRHALTEHDGPARFVVRRRGDAGTALSIAYATVDGTAIAGADYTPAIGTLNWPAADATPRVIDVALLTDTAIEPPEQFRLTLSTQAAGVGIAPSSAMVTILDAHDHILASDFAAECEPDEP